MTYPHTKRATNISCKSPQNKNPNPKINGPRRSAGTGKCRNRMKSHRTDIATEGSSLVPPRHRRRLSTHPNCGPRAPLPSRNRMCVVMRLLGRRLVYLRLLQGESPLANDRCSWTGSFWSAEFLFALKP
ncbi:pleckstrin homology-like domain family A member3 [Striga asiatica]|uniref:Pleckstrin homology-like domain family A member3 n=1 Tax=Striga asiatica TaxID=4170 RepID=A0A5A7PYS1_STRAF|nr:pleckstrin homology-like domain family A member3 [Striga asiatica]